MVGYCIIMMCPTLYKLFSTSLLNYLDGHDCNRVSHTLTDENDHTLNEYTELLTQQSRIGWDHLLRGKLSILWRQYQHQYECTQRMNRRTNSIRTPWTTDDTASSSSVTTSIGSSINSIDTDLSSVASDDSNSSNGSIAITFQSNILPHLPPDNPPERKPKKKRRTDRFQQFIDSALHAIYKELWIDRCNDRHRRIAGNCAALDTKVNRDVEDLYCKEDQICYKDRDTFFDLTLQERLQLPTYRKQQWVKRWTKNITLSVTRARKDTTKDTKEIYRYFNCTRKPAKKVNNHRIRAQKRKYEQQRAAQPLERTLDTFVNTTKRTLKSTSKPPPEKPPIRHTNPPITTFFTKKIDDLYPDEWND